MNQTTFLRLLNIPLVAGLGACGFAILMHPVQSGADELNQQSATAALTETETVAEEEASQPVDEPNTDSVAVEHTTPSDPTVSPTDGPLFAEENSTATVEPEETTGQPLEEEPTFEFAIEPADTDSESVEPEPVIPEAVEEEPVVIPSAPQFDEEPSSVKLTNTSNRYPFAFLLNGKVKQLAPGESVEVEGSAEIHFDRGAEFGNVFKELEPGDFRFELTHNGWAVVPQQAD